MLMNCKPGCSGKKITTTASLDLDTDQVVCDFCGEDIPTSSFVKRSMEQRGEIVRLDKRKSFQFECLTCQKVVPAEIKNDVVCGKGCQKKCQFEISTFIIHAMRSVAKSKINLEEDEK